MDEETFDALNSPAALPGGVASLVLQLTRTMYAKHMDPNEIANVQASVCQQFGIELPKVFTEKADQFSPIIMEKQNPIYSFFLSVEESNYPKKWAYIDEIRKCYPQLQEFSNSEIGSVLQKMGYPKKMPKGRRKYLVPFRDMEDSNG